MRRTLSVLAAGAALALGAATAAAQASHEPLFIPGTYSGSGSGERVLFTTDTHHAHNFSWGDRHLFDNAAIEKHDGVWRFHTHTTRWQVHGHWVESNQVQGSICALDSNGHCASEHLHHYTAALKTDK
jgi:hypothetical protein